MPVLILYTVTLFVGSTLLFMVQPMFAKMVIPLLGGSPSVWNTCQLFFQVALLAGYGYTHITSQRLVGRWQIGLHLAFLLTPLIVLPIALRSTAGPPSTSQPVLWLLAQLTLAVGLPFAAVSTGAPMMQRWFTYTDHPSAKDPYFLYAASNLGSMAGLLGYLVVVEPRFALPVQSRIWAAGYLVYLVLVAFCALIAFQAARGPEWAGRRARLTSPQTGDGPSHESTAVDLRQRLRWMLLAFVPSSLMLGVTTYLSTDVAAVPLLWIVPLTLYLLTYIAAFARRRLVPVSVFARLFPMLVLVQLVVLARQSLPLPFAITLHLCSFVCVAMYCHSRLADERPGVRRLTSFYLLISVGGALGGLLNAIVAPVLFRSVAEYPIVLILACAVMERSRGQSGGSGAAGRPKPGPADLAWPIALGIVALALDYCVNSSRIQLPPGGMTALYGVLALVCLATVERPVRFSLSLAAITLVYALHAGSGKRVLIQERSFFGVMRVSTDVARGHHLLTHGTTLHGEQNLKPEHRRDALTYYHRTGPIGECMLEMGREGRTRSCAIVGLGTGSLATYGKRGDRFTYYEIDPMVDRVAKDPRYFTFVTDAVQRGVSLDVVIGDARLTLARSPDHGYDLIVLDAFSSDAIPMHLLTREAVRVYLGKLSEQGLLAVHISNRYLDLAPVVGNLAADAGLRCYLRRDRKITRAEQTEGKSPPDWLLLSRHRNNYGGLLKDQRWQPVGRAEDSSLWTDDYSNILEAVSWRIR